MRPGASSGPHGVRSAGHSRKALDNSRRAYAQAQTQTKLDEATVAELQAALHAAETNLGDTDIIAPIVGTIVSRNVKIGQTVAAAQKRRRSSSLRQISALCNQWKSRRGCRRRNQARRQGFIHGRLFCRSSLRRRSDANRSRRRRSRKLRLMTRHHRVQSELCSSPA